MMGMLSDEFDEVGNALSKFVPVHALITSFRSMDERTHDMKGSWRNLSRELL